MWKNVIITNLNCGARSGSSGTAFVSIAERISVGSGQHWALDAEIMTKKTISGFLEHSLFIVNFETPCGVYHEALPS
jgi:hypothetical protein